MGIIRKILSKNEINPTRIFHGLQILKKPTNFLMVRPKTRLRFSSNSSFFLYSNMADQNCWNIKDYINSLVQVFLSNFLESHSLVQNLDFFIQKKLIQKVISITNKYQESKPNDFKQFQDIEHFFHRSKYKTNRTNSKIKSAQEIWNRKNIKSHWDQQPFIHVHSQMQNF